VVSKSQKGGTAMKADKKTESEVLAAINRFIETYTQRDIEGTLALLAQDPDMTIIGTGADENIVGIQQARTLLKRDYEQAGEISVKLGTVTVSAAGAVAWVFADSTWQVKVSGQNMKHNWRWTLVMEKRQGKWLIAQSHLSAPAFSQAEGQSFPAK
jgi:ketosteroid isomerase-like protein